MFANRKNSVEQEARMLETSRRMDRASRRRRNPPIRMELIAEESVIPLSCFDLSAVGAYLYSDYLFCVGEVMKLRLYLPSGRHPMDIVGEVIRVEIGDSGLRPGMGIAFRKIDHRDADELKQFLQRRFLTHV